MAWDNLKVLYVEYDDEIRNTMQNILDFEVKELYTAKDDIKAYSIYKEKKPDIIITNINLSGSTGIEFIKKIRKHDHSTKIIILTGNSDVDILLEAAELKLTKYLLIPIHGDKLFNALEDAVNEIKSFTIIEHNLLHLKENYIWDFKEKSLIKDSKEVHLTPKEKKILNHLFSNPNITVTYEVLMDKVWDDYLNNNIDTIKTMIKNIRKKLPKDTIKNIYGIGFKYQP